MTTHPVYTKCLTPSGQSANARPREPLIQAGPSDRGAGFACRCWVPEYEFVEISCLKCQLGETEGSSSTTGVFCPAASHHRSSYLTSTYIVISLNPAFSAVLRI